MKINDLIEELALFKAQHGNIDCGILTNSLYKTDTYCTFVSLNVKELNRKKVLVLDKDKTPLNTH